MDVNTPKANAPTFAELFTPKLVTVLREGYGAKELRADAFAGLTVAINSQCAVAVSCAHLR